MKLHFALVHSCAYLKEGHTELKVIFSDRHLVFATPGATSLFAAYNAIVASIPVSGTFTESLQRH